MSNHGDTSNTTTGNHNINSGVPDLEALLNPDEQRRFRRLCIPTEVDELIHMSETVQLHVQQIKANALPATDLEMAELLGDRLCQLVTEAQLDDEQRALARGAVEYFLLANDADDDLADVLGFDDDVRVFNSVARQLNRPDLAVQLTDLE